MAGVAVRLQWQGQCAACDDEAPNQKKRTPSVALEVHRQGFSDFRGPWDRGKPPKPVYASKVGQRFARAAMCNGKGVHYNSMQAVLVRMCVQAGEGIHVLGRSCARAIMPCRAASCVLELKCGSF
eukprot:scaffold72755_cov18-Tisochrysis_lutea.AAC.2